MEKYGKKRILWYCLLIVSCFLILFGFAYPVCIVIGFIVLFLALIALIKLHTEEKSEIKRLEREREQQEKQERQERQAAQRTNSQLNVPDYIYSIDGCRGRHIDIYENKAVITTKTNLGSIMAGGYNNGEKTIYYRDVIGIQFKLPTFVQIGYLQFETASCQATNNFFSENSFPFESSNISNREIEKVVSYVKDQVDKIRSAPTSTATVIQAQSPADELKKFKELLDMGVITQDEFDQKKKQLLGL